MSSLITTAEEWQTYCTTVREEIKTTDDVPWPGHVFMVEPTYFDVLYAINPHMTDHIGNIDKDLALQQWEALRLAFVQVLGSSDKVHVLAGVPELPDMVFSANHLLPSPDSSKMAILANLNNQERTQETKYVEEFLTQERGYHIEHVQPSGSNSSSRRNEEEAEQEAKEIKFDGQGDALWIPTKRVLLGGHGFRTQPEAYTQISTLIHAPVVLLRLVSADFYHLDTAICCLGPDTCLVLLEAFDETSQVLIRSVFSHILEVTRQEAMQFACNACCVDGKHVFIQRGITRVNEMLTTAGFDVTEFDTSEYMKSGGSVFCMKMQLWH